MTEDHLHRVDSVKEQGPLLLLLFPILCAFRTVTPFEEALLSLSCSARALARMPTALLGKGEFGVRHGGGNLMASLGGVPLVQSVSAFSVATGHLRSSFTLLGRMVVI